MFFKKPFDLVTLIEKFKNLLTKLKDKMKIFLPQIPDVILIEPKVFEDPADFLWKLSARMVIAIRN